MERNSKNYYIYYTRRFEVLTTNEVDNMQKYANYKEQFGRLKKALNYKFYLEAIFIEYAIIEDRFESVLRHSGKFNTEKHNSLNTKLKRIKEMQREKKGLTRKYFSEELIEEVSGWKEDRNKLIHALMKQSLHTEDLEVVARPNHIIMLCKNCKIKE